MKQKIKNYLKGLSDDQLAILYQDFLATANLSLISLEDVKDYILLEIGKRFLEENIGSSFVEKPRLKIQIGDTLWYVNEEEGLIEECIVVGFELRENRPSLMTVKFENGDVNSFDDDLYGECFFSNKANANEVLKTKV